MYGFMRSMSARPGKSPIAVETPGDGFVETAWQGRTLAIGDARLAVTFTVPRCVMTTLPQGDLPKDSGILRTAAQHNGVNVGVYASVVIGGTIRRGEHVTVLFRQRSTKKPGEWLGRLVLGYEDGNVRIFGASIF